MKKPVLQAISLGLAGVGLTLLVLSFWWVTLFPGTSGWPPEKAELWAKTKDRLHNLSFVVNAPPGSEPPRRYADPDAARAEYDRVKQASQELQDEFESAYNTPRQTAAALKWGGLGVAAVGLVGWFATRGGG